MNELDWKALLSDRWFWVWLTVSAIVVWGMPQLLGWMDEQGMGEGWQMGVYFGAMLVLLFVGVWRMHKHAYRA